MTKTVQRQRLRLIAEIEELRDRAAIAARVRPFAAGTVLLRGRFRQTEAVIDTEPRLFAFYEAAVRTLDGGDALLPLPAPAPDGSAVCGIRHLLLDTPRLQAILQAALRASAFGRVSLLAPLVTTVQEIAALRRAMERAMRALAARSIPFDEGIELGVCIRTPAAVIGSRALCEDADFVSVDVGLLGRLALAAPQTEEHRALWQEAQPLVRRLVEIAVGNAHAVGRRAILHAERASTAEDLAHWGAMGVDALVLPDGELPRVMRHLRA